MKQIPGIVWLALLLASAAGGWHFGSSVLVPRLKPVAVPVDASAGEDSRRPLRSVSHEPTRRSSWIERVKAAKPGEFQALIEEWQERFPPDERYEGHISPNASAALVWVHGMWLVKDPDGFLMAMHQDSSDQLSYPMSAAQAMVELMPDKAMGLVKESAGGKEFEFFQEALLSQLARIHPARYLNLNPDGSRSYPKDYYDGVSDWMEAVATLAKTDAPAAANACLGFKLANNSNQLFETLTSVAAAWKPGNGDFVAWANAIQDPEIRNMAHHAWLTAMAEKDPKCALAALNSVTLEYRNDFTSARDSIARRLAEEDPKAALELMIDHEERIHTDANNGLNPEDPFSANNPNNYGIRDAVLSGIASKLPDDPAEYISAFRQLSESLGRDSEWQRGAEEQLLEWKLPSWSAEDCRVAAIQWINDYQVTKAAKILDQLASRIVREDPMKAFAGISDYPEVMETSLSYEIIRARPFSERTTELLCQLPLKHWDASLGDAVGNYGEMYAAIIAPHAADLSSGFLWEFTSAWTQKDPEMAAQWVQTLPNPEASAVAAQALASRWFDSDGDAAASWVDALPPSAVRDAVVAGIVDELASEDSVDAWGWAETIADAQSKVTAFDKIAERWRHQAPPPREFQEAHRQARQQIGLPPYEKPREEDWP